MRKFVTLAPEVTAAILGCSNSHFQRHVKDKPLRVQWESKDDAGVKDGEGEEYTVSRKLLIDAPTHRTVGEEMTHGRRVSNG